METSQTSASTLDARAWLSTQDPDGGRLDSSNLEGREVQPDSRRSQLQIGRHEHLHGEGPVAVDAQATPEQGLPRVQGACCELLAGAGVDGDGGARPARARARWAERGIHRPAPSPATF